MAGVRWQTVLPLSLLILTLIASLNLFNYVARLPIGDSSSLLPDDDGAQLPRHSDRRHRRTNGDNALEDRMNERKGKSKRNSFQLFPGDEVVERKRESDNFERRQRRPEQDDLRQDSEQADDVKRNRNDDDDGGGGRRGDEKAEHRDEGDYAVDQRDEDEKRVYHRDEDEKRVDHRDADESRVEHRDDSVKRFNHNEAAAGGADVDSNKKDNVRRSVDSRLIESSDGKDKIPLPGDDTKMMANMANVGAIVKQMKQSDADGVDRKPVNPHPFKYVINSPTICADDDVYIVVYIHTATDHYKRRTVIRHTWGDTSQYDVTVRLVFVMGVANPNSSSDSTNTQNALLFEAEQYGDIVQEDFIDSYHNLTYKGVAALRWISRYCQQAAFVLKTDDDIFVNMFTLIRYLKKTASVAKPQGLLMCLVWKTMPVLRQGKWKVTKEEWPEDSYPTYCSGSAFFMSIDVTISMHRISYDVPFFWVDDFYITGLLPLKLGNITHRQFASAYVLNGDHLEDSFNGPRWYTYVFSHVHNLDRIQTVWDTLTKLVSGELTVTVKSRGVIKPKRNN